MKPKQIVITVAVLVAIIGLGVGIKLWIEDHDARLISTYELKQLHAQNDKLQADLSQVKADAAAKDKELASERQKAQTPAQQVDYIAKYANLRLKPVETQTAQVAGEALKQQEPAKYEVEANELPTFSDYIAAAERCKSSLAACQVENSTLGEQIQNRDQQISSLDKIKNGTSGMKLKWLLRGILGTSAAFGVCKAAHKC